MKNVTERIVPGEFDNTGPLSQDGLIQIQFREAETGRVGPFQGRAFGSDRLAGCSLVQGHAGGVVGKCDAVFFERRLDPPIGLGADFKLLARRRLNLAAEYLDPIMVHRGYAYIGHGYSNGITVLDVRDLKNPKPVAFLPCPPDTRAIHLQTHDDLLLAVNGPSMWTMQVDAQAYYSGSPADLLKGRRYTAGVRVFDIARPEAPREIAFMATEGVGPHRIWYVGGRYAYVSIHTPEFTDQVLAIVDMAEPTRPAVVGKWWIPGMWAGGGETPRWPKGRRYALHHALVAGNIA